MKLIMLQLRSARERIFTDLFFACFAKNFVPFVVKKNNRKDRRENNGKVREGIIFLIIFCLVLCVNFSFSQNNTIDSLKTLLKSAAHDTSRASIMMALAEEFNASHPDTVIPICKKVIAIIEKNIAKANNREKYIFLLTKATAFNNIGFIYANQGQIKDALDYFGRSLKLREETGDKQSIASSLNNIGYIYNNQGQIKEALDYFGRSLKLQEEIGDKKDIARSLNNIGFIYNNQGQIKEAMDYYSRSLKLQEVIGDKKGIAYSLNNIGYIFNKQGQINEALNYYRRSLKIREEIGDKKDIAYSLNNIGAIYYKQGQIKEAMGYYSRSLKIYEEIGDKHGIAYSLNYIGGFYLKEKSLSKAKVYADNSLALAKELGYPENIRNAELTLTQIDSARGNSAGAFEHYKLYIVYRDSIQNKENEKAAIRQQTKYEFEKALLVKEQEEKEKNRILEATVERRDRIQYSVTLIVIVVLLSFVMLIGKIKVNQKVAEGLIFFVFLILFEFILVLADPYIENFTGGAPGYKLLFNAIIAALIFPLHAFFERLLKRRLMKQNTIEHG